MGDQKREQGGQGKETGDEDQHGGTVRSRAAHAPSVTTPRTMAQACHDQTLR